MIKRLTVSTSFGQMSIGIFSGTHPLFTSSGKAIIGENSSIDDVLKAGLEISGLSLPDLDEIVIDIGPGGTSSVRTGVAYCNALSYANEIPIVAFSSLELLLFQYGNKSGVKAYSIAKSLSGMMYCGEYLDGEFRLSYVSQEDFIGTLLNSELEIRIIGHSKFSQSLMEGLVTNAKIAVDGNQYVENQGLLNLRNETTSSGVKFPALPIPITEQSL